MLALFGEGHLVICTWDWWAAFLHTHSNVDEKPVATKSALEKVWFLRKTEEREEVTNVGYYKNFLVLPLH